MCLTTHEMDYLFKLIGYKSWKDEGFPRTMDFDRLRFKDEI